MTDQRRNKYVIITPVKDEARYICETLESVARQTLKPAQWVIVDDGSTDETATVLQEYAAKHRWIKVISLQTISRRYPGSPVISAFQHGADALDDDDYDFIVKLDGDLRLPEDYFQTILQRFALDDPLGIGSGVYLEKEGAQWSVVRMPSYHAAGASKIIRKECFQQIGGFIASLGWDTIDEIKAQAKGWKTAHFPDVQFYHLKNEGTGIGRLRTNIVHGRIFYLTGGSPLYFLVKMFRRAFFGTPLLLGGILMTWGYLKAMILREKRLVTGEEAALYNRLLGERMVAKVSAIFR